VDIREEMSEHDRQTFDIQGHSERIDVCDNESERSLFNDQVCSRMTC